MRMVVLHLLISAPGSLSVQGSHLLECMMTMMRSVIGWRVKRVKIANMFFSELFWLEGLGIYWRYRNRYRAFCEPEKSIGIGIGKIWYRKKVSVSVSSKFGTGKEYRYRQNLVPEKSIGIGIVKIWYRKKVSVSVSLKIMGTVTLCNDRQLCKRNWTGTLLVHNMYYIPATNVNGLGQRTAVLFPEC